MQKTWYFEYESQHYCVKYTKGQYWFFLGKEKLSGSKQVPRLKSRQKTIWYSFLPYVCYDIILHFENNIK